MLETAIMELSEEIVGLLLFWFGLETANLSVVESSSFIKLIWLFDETD